MIWRPVTRGCVLARCLGTCLRLGFAAALAAFGLMGLPQFLRPASADSPGQPLVMTAVPNGPTSVTVTWYNAADGSYGSTDCLSDCETFLRFDLRYGLQ